MVVEVESQGQVQEFLGILKKRRWQVVLPALFVFSIGCTMAVLLPRLYVVSTRVELRPVRVEEDYQLRNTKANAQSREIGNAEWQIKHYGRIKSILDELLWDEYPGAAETSKRSAYIGRIQTKLKVRVLEKAQQGGSDFVDLEFEHVDGEEAAEFLNRLVEVWLVEVIERDRIALKDERGVLQNVRDEAWNEFETKGEELADLLRLHELEPDELKEGGAVLRNLSDPYLQALNTAKLERGELTQDIDTLQEEIDETQKAWIEEPENRPVEVKAKSVDISQQKLNFEFAIQDLKALQADLRPAHSDWMRYHEQIQELESKIAALEIVGRAEQVLADVEPNPAKLQLKQRMDALERQLKVKNARLSSLDYQITEIDAVYQNRVSTLARAKELKVERDEALVRYREVTQTFNDRSQALRVLNEAYQSPYEIVEAALAPDKPTKPNPLMVVALGLILGIGLGLGSAVLSELTKSGYRGVSDVTRVMAVPVLGVVNTIVTSGEIRRSRIRRIFIGLSSSVILFGVAWFTYAYARHPEWLSTDFLRQIEDLRMQLR